jgi:5,10-methylene-tetrahydrofolate dehydrogenase/methenyl tetrahydrofolate cyclohydrolase
MVLLEQSKVDLKGKRAVVLGRSDIVGKPVSYLLEKADATVTVCHSRTQNVQEIVSSKATHINRCRFRKRISLLLLLGFQIT